MKRKASISHDEATVRELRENPEFAAEYLRAALEDDDEPSVLLIALRRIAEARGGIAKVAKAAGIPRTRVERIAREETGVTADTALRLAKVLGTSPEFWLNLQSRYDLRTATAALDGRLDEIRSLRADQTPELG